MSSEQSRHSDHAELRNQKFFFELEYLNDPRYIDSSNYLAIESLQIPLKLQQIGAFVQKDLGIKNPIKVLVHIPSKNDFVIQDTSDGGNCIDERNVELHFDPTHPSILRNLPTNIGLHLSHELNHAARMQADKMGRGTLLDALISEGLAVYYEEHLEGNYIQTFWGHSLNEEQITQQWLMAQGDLFSRNFDYESWFFASDSSRPDFTGYCLGNTIVAKYMQKYQHTSMKDLVRKNSIDILKGSGFPYSQNRSWLSNIFRRK